MQDNSAVEPHLTLAQKRFYASEQCTAARRALQLMVEDQCYDTDSLYYQHSALDFVERHLHYLSTQPIVNIDGYLSNLRLMTNTKRSKPAN